MSIILKIGLVSIPIQLVNVVKNRYSISPIHNFSSCCKGEVGNKSYCKNCGKEVKKEEILKGLNKDTILTEKQLEALKNAEEGGILEVMSIKDITETTTYDLIPFILKSQEVFPSISKGYKKSNIITYYSFLGALKDLNKYAICKLVSRNCEHIGILIHYKGKVMFIEVSFKHYNNLEDLDSQKGLVEKVINTEKITELESFKEQASNFINSYKSKISETDEIKEEKKILLKSFIEEIETGIKPIEMKVNEKNPFE
jgi:non-homologous end joining protein Ku